MTDYLEEVLEEETEDREEFRPKRVVVRGSRRERPDVQEEDGAEGTGRISSGPDRTLRDREIPMEDRAEEESALLRDLSRNRWKAVPGENRSAPAKRRREREPEPERTMKGEAAEETGEAEKREDGEALLDLRMRRRAAVLQTAGRSRQEEDMVSLQEGKAPSEEFVPAEGESAVTEELAEAERLTRYGGTEDAYSETVPSGALSAWRESGREGAAGILLRALGRAGRVSRIVHGGAGTAVVTMPGEITPVWEPDMESLDRLVRLDARRYDGGFQLF